MEDPGHPLGTNEEQVLQHWQPLQSRDMVGTQQLMFSQHPLHPKTLLPCKELAFGVIQEHVLICKPFPGVRLSRTRTSLWRLQTHPWGRAVLDGWERRHNRLGPSAQQQLKLQQRKHQQGTKSLRKETRAGCFGAPHGHPVPSYPRPAGPARLLQTSDWGDRGNV